MSAIIYLLQVSACMAIFYGFYYFLLNRLTFFTINRYYLVVTLLLSFVIPLLTIHINQPDNYPAVVQQVVYVNSLQSLPQHTITAPAPSVVIDDSINWLQLLKWSYWLVAVALFIHLVIVLIRFFSKLKYRNVKRIGHVNILRGDKKLPNGSFLNYIFLNDDELSPEEMQQVIAHEMLHVKFLHSVDRIIAKMAQIVLWFNPFIYLYARSIEENHEFEVDREIARSTDKGYYADLLLHLSVAQQGMLYHNFSKVPLKKRITMLFNKPSANTKKIIYVLVLPVLVISCLAFAKLKKDDKQPKAKKLYSAIQVVNPGENPLVVIDGKIYPKDILYTISGSCVKGWGSGPGNASEIKKYGEKAKKRIINIKTKNGKIILMTPAQKEILKENSDKEAAIPATQFYTRLVLKKDDGKPYDKIIIHQSGTSTTSSIEHGAKVAFFVDRRRYSEDAIKKLSPKFIATLNGESGVDGSKAHLKRWPNVEDCESVMYFTTSAKSKVDQVKFPPPIVKGDKETANNGLKESERRLMGNTPLALGYFTDDMEEYKKNEKYLIATGDKTQLFQVQNNIAWTYAVKGTNLEWAEKISKQSVDIVEDLYEHPVAGLRWSAEEAKQSANGYRYMVGDTYAYILYKEGKYAQALKIQQPLYNRIINKNGGPVELHYAQILMANKYYAKAKAVLEVGIKSGHTEGLEPTLKASYIKVNGSDKGYSEYFAGLQAFGNSKKAQQVIASHKIGFGGAVKPRARIPNTTDKIPYVTTDTVEYDAKQYNAQSPDRLSDLLQRLPGLTVDDYNVVYFMGKKINTINVNNKMFANGNSAITVIALRAMAIDKLQIINPDANNDKTIFMNIQLKPAYNNTTPN